MDGRDKPGHDDAVDFVSSLALLDLATMTTLFTILFDGVAYGMLLFVLACGLAVTLGLMNFVNLAHGAFAMTGGYICAVLVNNSGWPFFTALPLAFVSAAAIGVLLERTLYRHLYTRSHLDQVLFTIGLTFMSVAAVDYIMGSSRIFIKLPAALEGQFDFFGVGIGRYRLMIIVICGLLTVALQLILAKTRFGSRLRAAVDDPRAASGLGINVPQVFAFTFAFGCGLGGSRRGAQRRNPRARSVFSAEIHDLLFDRGHRRRLLQHHRAVPRFAFARHRRRRRQILRAEDGPVRHLHHHDRDPDLASERPVRPRRRAVSQR